jgi:hypothetical protein
MFHTSPVDLSLRFLIDGELKVMIQRVLTISELPTNLQSLHNC